MREFLGYLTWQTFYLMLWAYFLFWLNLIPGFGSRTVSDLARCMQYNFARSFTSTSGLGYNTMFNIGYYASYIASCYVNTFDALLGIIASAATTAIVTAISYPVPELTPDKSVIDLWLVPLTLSLSCLAMYFFARWTDSNEPYKLKSLPK